MPAVTQRRMKQYGFDNNCNVWDRLLNKTPTSFSPLGKARAS
jgi:hypothetical protein